MDTAAVILGLLTIGATLYLVASPLFRPAAAEGGDEVAYEADEPVRDRESVFATLGELEFDHQMKKLSDDDYRSLENMYKRQAVAILKAEEAEAPFKAEAVADAAIEREIEAEIEAEIAAELAALGRRVDHED